MKRLLYWLADKVGECIAAFVVAGVFILVFTVAACIGIIIQ